MQEETGFIKQGLSSSINYIQELELRQEAKKYRGTSWPCWGSIRKAEAQLQWKPMRNIEGQQEALLPLY